MDPLDARTEDLINRFGWTVTGVFPTEDDPGPHFSYTVGLTAYGHPELLIIGLPPQTAGALLNDLGARVRDGQKLVHGQVLDDLIRGYQAVVVAGDPFEAWPLSLAYRRHGRAAVHVLQIVWPDKHGTMPWDSDWSGPAEQQPTIGRPS